MELKVILKKLISKNDLTSKEATIVFEAITSGKLSEIAITAFLTALSTKKESIIEITAATKVLRKKALRIRHKRNVIDTCGTGGDGKNTLNISTATAILTSACGLNVAKHGNKAVSSKSGSSDVLSELGVNIFASPKKVTKCLNEVGLCFLMAPIYHSAMKNVASVRSELKIKTIFNLLGPLLNPANADRQLIGVYSKDLLMPIANCLKKLGIKKAWVVHGEDGLDEITIGGKTFAVEVKNNKTRRFTINPIHYGIKKAPLTKIRGKTANYNASAILNLFQNKNSNKFFKNIVLINTAAVLVIADKVKDLREGIKLAENHLNNGDALKKLEELKNLTV